MTFRDHSRPCDCAPVGEGFLPMERGPVDYDGFWECVKDACPGGAVMTRDDVVRWLLNNDGVDFEAALREHMSADTEAV